MKMTIRVGIGLSTEKDLQQAARDAVSQARASIHVQKLDLAIVFSSVEYAHPLVLSTISSLSGAIPVVGCSSLAVISNQGIFKHALAVLLLSFPEGIYFNAAAVRKVSAEGAGFAGGELGEKLSYALKNIRRDLSVIFSNGLMRDGAGFLSGIQEKLGRSFPLAGASASDNLAFKKTYQYFGEEVLTSGACGILLGGKINFGLGVKHGWKPLGKPRYVTKAGGGTVEKIDNVPAANIYCEYLACDLKQLKKELRRISILYPIGIYLSGEEEYLLRNILSIEDNGTLVFQGDVPENCMVRLMIGTKESCLSATQQAIEEVKKGLFGRPCNFLLVFDSVSRYTLLGRQAPQELEMIKEKFGRDMPIMGLYTYGEQAPLKAVNYQGKTYFHNQTLTLLAIGG